MRRIKNKAKLSAIKVRKLTLRKNFFFTIQNLQFKGKVLNNLSWKFRDILYIRRFPLPPTILGDSLSELGLCLPPSVSCSSTTREYNKFLCHWLWLIMANWHLMPCRSQNQQNINAVHDPTVSMWHRGLERRDREKGEFCTIKRFGTLSDIPHFTLIMMTNIGQRILFTSRLKGKIQKGIPAQGQTVGLQEFLTSICLRRRKTRKKLLQSWAWQQGALKPKSLSHIL